MLTTVVLTSTPSCSDGGSGYVLPTLNGGSGLQPATPTCAAARAAGRPASGPADRNDSDRFRDALPSPRLRRCARATVGRCPVLVRLSRGRPGRQPIRCSAIPWPARPTCALKRQVGNRRALLGHKRYNGQQQNEASSTVYHRPEAAPRPVSGQKTATGVFDTWSGANLWETQTFTHGIAVGGAV